MEDNNVLFCTGIYRDGYGMIPKAVMKNKDISVEAKALYAYICSYAGSGGKAFPSLQKICEELGMSEKRLYKYRNELIANNLIIVSKERIGSKYSSNIYTLVSEPKKEEPKAEEENSEKKEVEPSQIEHVQNGNVQNGHVQNEPRRNVGTISNILISNNNKEKYKKEKPTSLEKIISAYTEDKELKDTLIDFIKMRKTIKKPVTDRALNAILKKLDNIATTKSIKEKVLILEQSIMNCYQGVFPLKADEIVQLNKKSETQANYKIHLEEDM